METNLPDQIKQKYNLFYIIARYLWPELDEMNDQRRLVGIGDVICFIYALPLAIIGIVWLTYITNIEQIRHELPFVLFMLGIIILFDRLNYFIVIEIRTDRYGSSDGSLATMALWSLVFLFGPSTLWLILLWHFTNLYLKIRKASSKDLRWNLARNLTMDVAIYSTAALIALAFYQLWGGVFPLPDLSPQTLLFAFGTLILHLFLGVLIWSGYILYHLSVQKALSGRHSIQPILRFFLLSFGLPYLAHPFAILAAGLYIQDGFLVYTIFMIGLLLVAYLSRQLSWAAENSRQQFRQLEKLEELGRDLIDIPPDRTFLTTILKQHLPNMFPSGKLAVWVYPDLLLLEHPANSPSIPDKAWEWILIQTKAHAFLASEPLPWNTRLTEHPAIITAPILESESARPLGGILIELRALVQPWDIRSLSNLFPALQSLAGQISSALHQAEFYEQSLAYQSITQELKLAGKIQASFLPNKFPSITGWQIAVTLLPARETSGDFFDVIDLSNGRLGILVADVADKGVGPALYMALTRTLIRTYAVEYDAEPEVVFFAANNRLLNDARANLFVTAFYGILDPGQGTLTYCNAGHNPPLLIRSYDNGKVESLSRTGIAVGIEEDATWTQASIKIDPGDILLLYTDGIPDAQNVDGMFFEEDKLIEIAQASLGRLAHEIQTTVLEDVQRFVGEAPQSDDITLMVLVRDL